MLSCCGPYMQAEQPPASPLHDQRMRLLHEENLRLKQLLQQECDARQQLQREHDGLLALLRWAGGPARLACLCLD